ncbi:MAG TPA: diacylglycerol kinase family protein [Symbiobacteriaceae bacterium]|nr:diacylglycerol kinase family protein [Symbiobacteriaceae bacterium]
MRPCFIVNPTAGHGRALQTWRKVEALAQAAGEYGIKITKHSRHGEALAREAVAEGYDRVIVLGGDGTVNEVIQGLIHTEVPLAVIPTGTGNDWVRTAGVPRDIEKAFAIAYHGQIARHDVGLIHGQRYFMNIAGVGFDAEASRFLNDNAKLLKVVPGTLPTLLSIVGTLFRFRGAPMTCIIDGEPVAVPKLFLMAVGLNQYYGGGMQILPQAIPDDGYFDLAWADELPLSALPGLMAKIYKGQHLDHPKVQTRRAKRVRIESAQPVAYHLDGDVAGTTPVEFELIPQALSVMLPAKNR